MILFFNFVKVSVKNIYIQCTYALTHLVVWWKWEPKNFSRGSKIEQEKNPFNASGVHLLGVIYIITRRQLGKTHEKINK